VREDLSKDTRAVEARGDGDGGWRGKQAERKEELLLREHWMCHTTGMKSAGAELPAAAD
jgi:hypothetical protein